MNFRPTARRAGLVVQDLPDELLLYDTERYRAHCLNRQAALIWRHCDGQSTPEEIAGRVGMALETPVSVEMVWHALYQLSEFHLLDNADDLVALAPVTRRELMLRLLASGAVVVPLVSSIVVPSASQAGSTGSTGGTGGTGSTGATGP